MEAHLRQHCAPVLQSGGSAFCANGSVSHVHGFLTQQLFKTPRSIALLSNASPKDQGCRASSYALESIFETNQLTLPACLGSLSLKP